MLERRSRQDEIQTEQCKEKTDSGVRDRAAIAGSVMELTGI